MAHIHVTNEAVGNMVSGTTSYTLASPWTIPTTFRVTVGTMDGEWVPFVKAPVGGFEGGLLPSTGVQFCYSIERGGPADEPDKIIFSTPFSIRASGLAIVVTYDHYESNPYA